MIKSLKELFESKIEQTCCFTGHRSHKLPWGENKCDSRYLKTKLELKKTIIRAIRRGYTTFVSGMATGADMMCAELALELKHMFPNIKLMCVMPCKNQDKLWSETQKSRYKSILTLADGVVCLQGRYTKRCMEERNKYMVDNSTLIIAVFDGTEGGTKNTIEYAKQKGKEIISIEPVKVDEEYIQSKIEEDEIGYIMHNDEYDDIEDINEVIDKITEDFNKQNLKK